MVEVRHHVVRCVYLWATLATMLTTASPAAAAPGYIANSRVTESTTGNSVFADIRIVFNCKTHYVRHDPGSSGDSVRIYLEPTAICNGVPPTSASSRSRLRPFNSDLAKLLELEYDGDLAAGPALTLSFSEAVSFEVDMQAIAFELIVRVKQQETSAATNAGSADPNAEHRLVLRPVEAEPELAINLKLFERVPTFADAGDLEIADGQRLFYEETVLEDGTRYRLRIGKFRTAEEAGIVLDEVLSLFPDAWIDEARDDADHVELAQPKDLQVELAPDSSFAGSKVDTLMRDAQQAIVAGETSRAVQIYTKVLQLSGHSRHAEAQEFLGLAREKNGQLAHAKAEYQRYLSLYADADGADRVRQRLSVILAGDRNGGSATASTTSGGRSPGNWRYQTFFSQYYRKDVNQLNDEDEIVSQSALYSDINLDIRRRGDRFDFSSRISAGYRNSFLDATSSRSDKSTRVSYAYADLSDATTGLRGRIGRQSRNTGGVLGRFDGLNLGFQVNERILLNTVIGKPAYSATDDVDDTRTFYGASVNYGPVLSNLDLGAFYIQQDIEGIKDRQAVGAEFRYFGERQSLWGRADYDLEYGDLASTFLQGSWRFENRLTLHALASQHGSPFLSTSNALIGQPVLTFAELAIIFSEEELRQLARDRTSISTTYTLGASYPITPRFQINVDASQSTLDATPASGGIFETPGSSYSYYSATIVASSLLKEGDVSIVSARYSDSNTSSVVSLHVDTRIPFGRQWRINPRLRVDRRERVSSPDYEWLYTPGIRIQYRRSQKFRIEFEAGKQFSQLETFGSNVDRESYFINLGYQAFF